MKSFTQFLTEEKTVPSWPDNVKKARPSKAAIESGKVYALFDSNTKKFIEGNLTSVSARNAATELNLPGVFSTGPWGNARPWETSK